MKSCAFLTLGERGDFVIDDEHAIAPLEALGWRVSTVSWRQTAVPWGDFDLVVIRSTWDYWNDVPGFLDVLADIDRETRLLNPLALVHWNLNKTYLRDLEARSVRVVPTAWPDEIDVALIDSLFGRFGSNELVIKPVVGANGEDAYRLSREDGLSRWSGLAARFRGRQAMVQRFLPRVLDEGEFSLFYFDGEYSHAILKVPAAGEFRSQEERGAGIRTVTPEPELAACGRHALDVLDTVPLYARIDFVRADDGGFCLMEQELIEPSMYLRTDPGAPERFAAAIDRCGK